MSEKLYKVKVSGTVQRAGYRPFVFENAQELGVCGHACMSVFVQGEKGAVKQFLEKIKEPRGRLPLRALGLRIQT
jgi:hydrogenase maturation factor HypF (carbamoyltransferase family)